MIYNFYAWLKARHPSYAFTCNNFRAKSPDNCILVKLTTGTDTPDYPRKDASIQILVRNKKDSLAFKIMNDIFTSSLESGWFFETLPEVTVEEVVYPSVIAAKIVPNQLPGAIGTDNENRYMYSVNVTVTTK